MAWFGKRQNVLDRRLREIDKELGNLDSQVRRLQRAPGKGAPPKSASTVYPSNHPPPAEAAPAAPTPDRGRVSFGTPRQRELWSRHAPEEEVHPPGGGGRSWWQQFFPARQRPADPKLVSYLSTGSFKAMRPLRYERRMARYRFLFSFALLVGALLALVFALKNC
jgi:hypothetical protein